MTEPIIDVQHLSKRFGNFQALTDVSFRVHKGDIFGFLGPNGAGKSTTIRSLLSLIQPDQGSIHIFGKTLIKNRAFILARTGSIIEKPDFYKYLSAFQNLSICARISGADVSKRAIEEILDFVGLGGREKDKVGGFSHGMKQRLGIAQTLLHQPELILLDEPTTGLDPQGIIDIRNLILRLQQEQGKTILLSSHLLAELELIATRMVIINKGRTIVEGDVSELLNSEELIVQLDVDNPDGAIALIKEQFQHISIIQTDKNVLTIGANKMEVAALNHQLNAANINVFSIESKRKLEDYFIKILNEHVVA